mgnify:CR=1 FL=1
MVEAIRTQECCYLSTPKHLRSFIGRFIYIYTAKGNLRLTSESLIFTSTKTSFEIPVNSITDIRSGHYSRIAKPIRLDYIAVKYSHEGRDETILLTPTQSWATPVWKTNKLVVSWISLLDETVHKQ